MITRWIFAALFAAALAGFGLFCAGAQAQEPDSFMQPPAEDRPWVYWFWKNGNISRDGITADLEAMQRVGIGGVIVMEVALSVPKGPVPFFSEEWRKLFSFAVTEADRLGLKVTINSAPGWTGSGGAWITPELSMKDVTESEVAVTGPRHFNEALPQPPMKCDFYRDIAVLAFPTPAPGARIADIDEKALYKRGPYSSAPGVRPNFPSRADYDATPPDQAIAQEKLVDLTARMNAEGKLDWDAPEGAWTIMRFGYTSTGQTNRPAPLPGLECDKLDKAALETHFKAYIAKLAEDAGPLAGKALAATHFDSWEVGGQNWTGAFREEFQKRRGYDPVPFLPAMAGRVVGSMEISERFLWDLRQTVSDMIAEYHGQQMRDLAHQYGLWLSIEPYDMTPCDDMTLGAAADVPMCEFWSSTFDTRYSVREAVSIAHVYGKPVVAAEAFTSIDRWLFHPGSLKALGDWGFSQGVNRFVIHRYIHQPFPNARPGLSLGPHGVHYERTQTWWEYSKPWHEYLARCQYALRQGTAVADLLYLSPEGAPNVFHGPDPAPAGHALDACTPEALLTRVSVKDGRLVLPDGMSYCLLVLPNEEAMTPKMLGKIRELVEAGATVVGPPPVKSPSLSDYPSCDKAVREGAGALWGGERMPAERKEHTMGAGRVTWGGALNAVPPKNKNEDALAQAHWIWHAADPNALAAPVEKRYFRRLLTLDPAAKVAGATLVMTADNSFKVWVNGMPAGNGENFGQRYSMDIAGKLKAGANMIAVAVDNGGDGPNPAGLIAGCMLRFEDGKELRVDTDSQWQSAASVEANWMKLPDAGAGWPAAAEIGVMGMQPWGMVRETLPFPSLYPSSESIAALLGRMGVAPDFESDAPLRFAHRQTEAGDLYFVSNGQAGTVTAKCVFRVAKGQPELWHPEDGGKRLLPQYIDSGDGRTVVRLQFEAAESYFILFPRGAAPAAATGKVTENFPERQLALSVPGPWTVTFDPGAGGPEKPVVFEALQDWSQRTEPEIRYYSGTAVYASNMEVPEALVKSGAPLYLDLGCVETVASVKLNGKDLGIVWKAPFRVAINNAARTGENTIEVRVANLWPNRMIGDELLPPDSKRNENGTLKKWPQWLLDGKESPTGRHSFATWRHWTADDALLPSGLLGPVTVQQAAPAE